MNVLINRRATVLPEAASLADALRHIEARPPFATAVNQQFVPRAQHADTVLREGDEIEVIQPVTGG